MDCAKKQPFSGCGESQVGHGGLQEFFEAGFRRLAARDVDGGADDVADHFVDRKSVV